MPTSFIHCDLPPVAEVALAVQLDAPVLDALDVANLGAVLKGDLPKRVEQPPRPPMEERFDTAVTPQVRFEVLEAPP